MQGYHVPRKAGWDTHGLPVEHEIEKELGIFDKKENLEFSEKFINKKCVYLCDLQFKNYLNFQK